MSSLLIIRPRSGTFLKNADWFKKMDPWVKVTVGTESQRTETAANQGKNPFWQSTLNFKLSSQQITQADSILVTFEALDEDGPNKHDFLGSAVLKLAQLVLHPQEHMTITVLDKKNKTAGTLEVDFEFQKAPSLGQSTTPYGQSQYKGATVGAGGIPNTPLIVKAKSGKFLKDHDMLSGMDPYIQISIGNDTQRTETAVNAGKYPTWKKQMLFKLTTAQSSQPEHVMLNIEAFDEDSKTKSEFIGGTTYRLSQVRAGENTSIELFDRKNNLAGTIEVVFDFQHAADTDEARIRQTTALFNSGDTIVFKPKSGKFLKDVETFGKMDPFVRVSIDQEALKTEVDQNAGKLPNWRTPLPFKLSNQQIYSPENVNVIFEAHDDEGKGKTQYLGSYQCKLFQLNIVPGETRTIELLDKKGKPVGTIDVDFEVADSKFSDESVNARNFTSLFRDEDTLIIKPKKGTFVKDVETFGKMDPFVKITLDRETLRTETATNQGKTPSWTTPLNFKLTRQQISNPQNVLVNIEAHDEQSATKSQLLASKSMKLSQLRVQPGVDTVIELKDKFDEKTVGTLTFGFDVQDSRYSKETLNANSIATQLRTKDTLVFKPRSGNFKKNADTFSKMDPWVNIVVDSEAKQTEVAYKAGKTPTWNTPLRFELSNAQRNNPDGVKVTIEAFDEDSKTKSEFLGSTSYPLNQLRVGEVQTIQLYDRKSNPAGTIDLEFVIEHASQSPEAVNKAYITKMFGQADTLIIRPRSGQFLKDVETFGKMDPFVRITIDGETKKTETATNAGKTPSWTTPLAFRLSKQQVSQLENVIVNIEAQDEEAPTKSRPIGSRNYRLSQLKVRAGEPTVVELFDTKEKSVGTINLDFEFQDSRYSDETLNANNVAAQLRAKDSLVFKPRSGNFLKDLDLVGKMDPYVNIIVDRESKRTETAVDQGKTPSWNTPLRFNLSNAQRNNPDAVKVTIEAYDEDSKTKSEFIGHTTFILNKLPPGEVITVKLQDVKGYPAGTIDLEFNIEDSRYSPESLNKNFITNLFNTEDTLIIRPKAGRFLKDAETFGKMDPFVKVTVDGETKKTETAMNASKSPYWQTPLAFKLTRQQISNPDNVLVVFEAHNEQTPTKSQALGSVAYKLSQLKVRPGETTTVELFNQKENPIGVIDLEFAVQDSRYSDESLNANKIQNLLRTKDTVIFRPRNGKFTKDADTFSKMDPFVNIVLDSEAKQTETAYKAGKTPSWKKDLVFNLSQNQRSRPESVKVVFEVRDEDSKTKSESLGFSQTTLAQLRPNEIQTVQLYDNKGYQTGTIEYELIIEDSRNLQTPHTLILRPRNGKFNKDADFFSKMDPYVQVTLGLDKQRTETAHNAGKTPSWNTPITFKLTNEQLSNPDSVVLNIEAYDEDSKTKSELLGTNVVRLSQVRSRNEVMNVQVLDKKNYVIGTIDIEFEIQQAKPSRSVIGTVAVKPTQGRFESGVTDRQQFYLVFTHGDVSYQSLVSEGSGRRPIYKDILSFQFLENQDMVVRCFDNDERNEDLIGEGVIRLSALAQSGDAEGLTIPLTLNGRKVGELDFGVEFYSEVFNNPVRVYPTLNVRRGEYISKKMKYTNPDRFRKNLTIRSDNRDLVFVKNEHATVNQFEYVEIRFRVNAPKQGEGKCRVDIIVEETGVIEESLLFKIRSI